MSWEPGDKESKRQAVYDRDGRRCLACGNRSKLTLDHIVPQVLGGTNDFLNLQTLCERCNRAKGAQVIDYRGQGPQFCGTTTLLGFPGTYQPITRGPSRNRERWPQEVAA